MFFVGNLVCLKSGGPIMTISWVSPYDSWGDVTCTWFDQDGNVKYGTFNPKLLDKITSNIL